MGYQAAFCTLTAAQLDRLVEIEQRSFANPWSRDDFCQVLSDPRALCMGIALPEVLVGYAIGYLDGTDFHLANLAVDPPFRRQGWGSRLLCQALAEASRKGCQSCSLEVRVTNLAAGQFYGKHGFQQLAVRLNYYRGPRENALLMRRTIEKF